jgi:TolB-like protein
LTLCLLGLTFIAVMSSAGETDHSPLRPSIFLSYASEDRTAASSIRDTMTAAGLEVWYDENELGGGDAWDKKIRKQIRECDYFMAVISAQTEARHEGYFRREWRLAVERALDMADDHAFLLPVVIDGTQQAIARVPERFLDVQWLKVPNGLPNSSLTSLCTRLIAGSPLEKASPRRTAPRAKQSWEAPVVRAMPAFPTEEAGQRVKFWVQVAGWAARSSWIGFQRLPRWIRLLVYLWLAVFLMNRGCSREPRPAPTAVSPEIVQKLKAIEEKRQGTSNKADLAKLGAQVAREFADEPDENPGETRALLAIPFTTPADDAADSKLADSTFALLYEHISIAHQGAVGLSKEPMLTLSRDSAVERGRETHSKYVLFGGIENINGSRALNVEIVKVADGSNAWSKDYPVANADTAAMVLEIESKIPSLDDDR